jgi:hypothetical protein
MTNIMNALAIFLAGMIVGIGIVFGTLVATGHFGVNTSTTTHTISVETTEFNGFEFR